MTSHEERQYYRDLADQNNENISQNNTTLSQTNKKSKSQVCESEKEKNSKKLLSMLGNMKSNKAEVKSQSSLMRTFVNWTFNLDILTEKTKTQW